jgi:transcriptional regulator with XRE-family HTH domain
MRILKRHRFALGLTQTALARKVGVSVAAVSNWESGQCLPTPAHFRKLARAFGIAPLELSRVIDPDGATSVADGSAA